MKKKLCLVVNVTRDPRVHQIIENTISSHKSIARRLDRYYCASPADFSENIPGADIIFSFGIPENVLRSAPSVQWIHFASAGIDRSFNPVLAGHKAIVSCSRGIHAATIAEYVLMMMLAISKNLRPAFEHQNRGEWRFEDLLPGKFDLRGKSIAIIGLGSIGARVARLAKAFDMQVTGISQKFRAIRNVDKIYRRRELNSCLKTADFVLLSVPLTGDTLNLIGPKQFSMMKKSAYIINIGRGKLIDENALITALQNGHIAGAVLDVFASEPLPPESPLWRLKNVIITPHYSGMAENLWETIAELFCENAARFFNQKRLLGTIDRAKGY